MFQMKNKIKKSYLDINLMNFGQHSSYCRNIFFLSMKVMLSKIRWCNDSRFCRNPRNAVVHRGVGCVFLDLFTLGLYPEGTLVLSLRIKMEGSCLVITTCTTYSPQIMR